jgi:hypothetical protein
MSGKPGPQATPSLPFYREIASRIAMTGCLFAVFGIVANKDKEKNKNVISNEVRGEILFIMHSSPPVN